MDRTEINRFLSAILTTLLETGSAIESTIYLALEMDMNRYSTLRVILVSGGLATVQSNVIRLTAKGKDLAEKINAARPTAQNSSIRNGAESAAME